MPQFPLNRPRDLSSLDRLSSLANQYVDLSARNDQAEIQRQKEITRRAKAMKLQQQLGNITQEPDWNKRNAMRSQIGFGLQDLGYQVNPQLLGFESAPKIVQPKTLDEAYLERKIDEPTYTRLKSASGNNLVPIISNGKLSYVPKPEVGNIIDAKLPQIVSTQISQTGQTGRQNTSIEEQQRKDALATAKNLQKDIANREIKIGKLKQKASGFNLLTLPNGQTQNIPVPENQKITAKTELEGEQKAYDQSVQNLYDLSVKNKYDVSSFEPWLKLHPDKRVGARQSNNTQPMMTQEQFIYDFQKDQNRAPSDSEIKKAQGKYWQ